MRQLLLFLFLISIVAIRILVTKPNYTEGDWVRISSRLDSEPFRSSFYQNFSLAKLKISLPAYPQVHYGDYVVVEGKIEKRDLKYVKLVQLKPNSSGLLRFRETLTSFYDQNFPQPASSLLAGIVLGVKSGIPSDFWNSLTKTGTAHVVVASGMNVTFVAGFLMSTLLLFMRRRFAIPLAIIGIWFYSLLSGFEAPIVRAAIMGSLAFTAQELGRLVNAWKVLVLTSLIMLIYRPEWISDLGFILSFVATSSLMLFTKPVEKLFLWLPNPLKEGFVTSLAAQIGVAPILFVTFGQFNIFSPIINAFILWTIPYIMVIGAVGGLIGLFWPFLGRLILYLVYPLTWWFIGIVNLFG